MQDISDYEGRVIHASADVEGADWVLSLCRITYPDGTPVDGDEAEVELDAQCAYLSPAEARRLPALITATAEAQR